MPYNSLGDLYKAEIVFLLRKMGCNIKNVHELNLTLEKMGLLIRSGSKWLTSKEGVKYTIYSGQTFNADGWHPEIVKVIYNFLKRQ